MVYTAKAYAKTNLFLDVVSKRDDGYHDINSVMQSLSLCDIVTVELTDSDISVKCDKAELDGSDNIAYNACKSFLEFANLSCGVRVNIQKNIPVAAGLGGGSADAAAVLVLLNIATEKNYPISDLIPIAASLGADVPFFLIGGTVKANGIGEILTKLPDTRLNFVLIKEYCKQSTGTMYQHLDSFSDRPHGDFCRFIENVSADPLTVSTQVFNSFEACWDMNKLSKPFKAFCPLKTFLSGSGPAVCALFENSFEADACAKALNDKGIKAFSVFSVPVGIEVV